MGDLGMTSDLGGRAGAHYWLLGRGPLTGYWTGAHYWLLGRGPPLYHSMAFLPALAPARRGRGSGGQEPDDSQRPTTRDDRAQCLCAMRGGDGSQARPGQLQPPNQGDRQCAGRWAEGRRRKRAAAESGRTQEGGGGGRTAHRGPDETCFQLTNCKLPQNKNKQNKTHHHHGRVSRFEFRLPRDS
jgi:hypothetical protein